MEGTRLGGYQILSTLGSGGMGKVYRAEVKTPAAGLEAGTLVALKIIHPHLLETPGFFKRFLREAEIGGQVDDENVVRTYDCDATLLDGVQLNYLVMELVEGQTLRHLLDELDRVPEELCRHIGREVAQGLAAIHAVGVVHRDLKPENAVITDDQVVKVMDLGIARLQDEVIRLSIAGRFMGSVEYAAPEQFTQADGRVDGRADLHALGVMLYELATGQHPYRDEDTRRTLRNVLDEMPRRAGEINPQLSPFFEELVHQLMAKDPVDRLASAADLVHVFDEGEAGAWWRDRARALRISTRAPLRRVRIPRETALYGRDEELAALHALFDDAKAGVGRVVLIGGEAGIGKTRLVDEFVGRLRQQGEDINFLFGSYPSGGAATSAGAFSTAYREHFGEASLEETLEDFLPSTPVLIPAFAALLRGESTPSGAEALTEDSLQTVFVHATRALAAERPTILMIDDLHFSPQKGLALFASLALAIASYPVLLVGTSRPGIGKSWVADLERHEHATAMKLARLGPKDLVSLLEDAFRSERLAKELAGQIGVKSDGNPFFAFEIIRGLREGQFITQTPDGAWVSTQVIHEIQIPSSLMDLIQARIGDLDDDEANLLDVASCCGFAFDPLLVAAVLELGQIPALQRLARIEKRRRLVRSAGRRFLFDHHQIQEALYEGLPVLLRERYHAAIGNALEPADPEIVDPALAVELCDHFLKGANGVRALPYLDRALEHLEHGYLNDQAIELGDRALDVPGLLEGERRAEILLRKNDRLDLIGRRAEQRETLAEARAILQAGGSKALMADVERGTGVLLWRTGHADDARPHFERQLEIAREIGDREAEAHAIGRLGVVFRSQSAFADARACFRQVLEITRESGDRLQEARATGNLGVIALLEGDHEEARVMNERALELFCAIGDRKGEATSMGNLGIVLIAQGRLGDALSRCERFLEVCREIGDRQGAAVAMANLGVILRDLGALAEADRYAADCLEVAREVGYRRGEAHATSSLALSAQEAGDTDEAERLLRQTLALRKDIRETDGTAATLTAIGQLLTLLARPDEAAEILEEAAALAREAGVPGTELMATCRLALVRPDTADAAVELFTEREDTLRHDELMIARLLLWQATGDPAHLVVARRLLDHLVEHAPEQYRESTVTNVSVHREIADAHAEHVRR